MHRTFLLLAILLPACSPDKGSAEPATEKTEEAGETEEMMEDVVATETALPSVDPAAMGIAYGRASLPGIVTGGQLTEEQFTRLAEMGYDTLVSLRPTSESGAGWEEEFAATVGATFHRIPVAGRDGINEENAEKLTAILDDAGDGGVVVYCASSNRVGALFALKAHFLDGEDVEQSLEIGKATGLTALEPLVRELLKP